MNHTIKACNQPRKISSAHGGTLMNDPKTILIADDNNEIREIVRVLLESENYEVIEAVDGEDAVNKVTDRIDLIILDIMMPVKSGLKACIDIREKTSAPI